MTSAPSNFLSLLNWLNDSAIPYFIAWGYESLPEQPSGGDVDLYVHPGSYDIVAHELTQRGYASDLLENEEHLPAQFGCAGLHTIHLFSSFCFNFQNKVTRLRIDAHHLLQGRLFVNGMWVANPTVELLFTALRFMGGRTDVVNRLNKFLEELE